MDTFIVRRFALQREHLPVPIYSDPDTPIPADWVAVVRYKDENPDRERFVLTFLDVGGMWLEGLQYETLQIALDQAGALLGIRPDQWEMVDIPLDTDDLGPWPGGRP